MAAISWFGNTSMPAVTSCEIQELSLTSGQVPDRFKVAMLKPLFKNSEADRKLFSNFRPVSNLYFLSKVTEKAALLVKRFFLVFWMWC